MPASSSRRIPKYRHYNGTVRLRCVTESDAAQKVRHRLGITLPRRLRRIDEFVPMSWKLAHKIARKSFADGQSCLSTA
jgi:hypothetical protein